MTADAVYIVRDPQLCPNKANSWPLVSSGLTMSSMAAPAPAGSHDCTCMLTYHIDSIVHDVAPDIILATMHVLYGRTYACIHNVVSYFNWPSCLHCIANFVHAAGFNTSCRLIKLWQKLGVMSNVNVQVPWRPM